MARGDERLFAQLVEQHSTAELAKASRVAALPPKLGEVFYRQQRVIFHCSRPRRYGFQRDYDRMPQRNAHDPGPSGAKPLPRG